MASRLEAHQHWMVILWLPRSALVTCTGNVGACLVQVAGLYGAEAVGKGLCGQGRTIGWKPRRQCMTSYAESQLFAGTWATLLINTPSATPANRSSARYDREGTPLGVRLACKMTTAGPLLLFFDRFYHDATALATRSSIQLTIVGRSCAIRRTPRPVQAPGTSLRL